MLKSVEAPVQKFSIKNTQFLYSSIKLCFILADRIKASKEGIKQDNAGLEISPLKYIGLYVQGTPCSPVFFL